MAVNPIFDRMNKLENNKIENNILSKSIEGTFKDCKKTTNSKVKSTNVENKNQHSKIKNIMDFNNFKKDFKFKLNNKKAIKDSLSYCNMKNHNSINFNFSNLTNTSKNKNKVDLSYLKKITEEYIDIDINEDHNKLLSDSKPKTTTSKVNKEKFLKSLYGINHKSHHSKKESNGKNESVNYNNSMIFNKFSKDKESDENFIENKTKSLNNFTSYKLNEILNSLDEISNYPTNSAEDLSSVLEIIQRKINSIKDSKLLYTLRLENGKRSSTYKNSEISNKECTSIKSEFKNSDTFQEIEFSKFHNENKLLSKSMNLSKSDSKKSKNKPFIPCLTNLDDLPKNSFNQELLQHYDEFSPSWREDVDKINLS